MKNFIIAIASVAALGLAEAAKEPLEVITRILGVKWSTISGTGGQLARNMQRTKSNSLRGKPYQFAREIPLLKKPRIYKSLIYKEFI